MIVILKNKMVLMRIHVGCFLLIASYFSAIQTTTDVTTIAATTSAYLDRVKVSGGWTEVSKRWPLGEQNGYFIADTKGFHPIEIAIPVEELSSDLEMHFEYWFDYKQVHPTMEIVPCSRKEDLTEQRGRWNVHKRTVKKEDCTHRKMLAYNVLLHDDDDVFAWRLLEISSVITSDEDKTRAPDWQETAYTEIATQTTLMTSESVSTMISTQTTTQPPQAELSTFAGSLLDRPSTLQAESGTDIITTTTTTSTETPTIYDMRAKRFSGWFGRAKCTPVSCNRNLFKMSNFRTVVRGLPPVTSNQLSEGKNLYLSNGERPFELTFESSDDLREVNSCLDLQIYMEADTSLEFLIREGADRERTLELIERKSTDSSCNKWESFKRCINDYLPKLHLPSNNSHSVQVGFQPKTKLLAGKQIGLLFDPNTVSYTKKMYPIHQYLPNALSLSDERGVDEYWILDRDGYTKPQLTFESSSKSTSERKLRISHIDSNQEHFDLISRWVQFDDTTLQSSKPLLFIYLVEQEDWIESIDFGYQSADGETPDWISQKVYTPNEQAVSVNDKVSSNKTNQQQDTASSSGNSSLFSVNNLIPLPPIKLKGLSKGEFRVRVRHHLKKQHVASTESEPQVAATSHLTSSQGHQLVIRGLAFGDLCAQGAYCKNHGTCIPLGAARAKCTCLAGYSGENCEKVNHCQVYYGDKTGEELCKTIGATCIPLLPVFRCHWPNDEYYECKTLYMTSETGELLVEPTSNSSQVAMWRERAESQSRLIIVLSVLMIAMLLFTVVIVVNLVSRLFKSRKNLKGAQMEVVELSRRPRPGPSGVASFDRVSSAQPKNTEPASISYSNRSFDASG